MFNKLLTAYNKLFVLWVIVGGTLVFFFLGSCAHAEKEILVVYQTKPQRVTYDLYMPKGAVYEPLPVLVCVGGLPTVEGQYVQSSTQECMSGAWKQFADENRVAILGLGFLFIEEDWSKRTSYQYPKAWSSRALFEVLDNISEEFPISPKELYLFGISAGAQFSIRFAQMRPDIVKAVAAHASGGYDLPTRHIPTKFLLTVGELDNEDVLRRGMSQRFVAACKEEGIDIELKIIPGIAHRHTEEQNEMSRRFFKKAIK